MRFSKKYDGAKTMTGEQRQVVMALLQLSKGKKRSKRRSSPRRSPTKRRRSKSRSPSAQYKRIQSMRASGKYDSKK